jgi:hypothetical protein
MRPPHVIVCVAAAATPIVCCQALNLAQVYHRTLHQYQSEANIQQNRAKKTNNESAAVELRLPC